MYFNAPSSSRLHLEPQYNVIDHASIVTCAQWWCYQSQKQFDCEINPAFHQVYPILIICLITKYKRKSNILDRILLF